ncbi:uncharacterized protein PV06_04963 [Exophiala oligosperma]|uniref:FAD/NAD(P)-binding domain-containing protein n=1 Tax=Exophiala oligosperma TaxID=215243 RepID=A0A0D2DLT1_9EURO|nr:uncharacterized protein PV06_04963 [Exophiala oligosperma]KIW43913.1 hypothetical protein PV06_04963 [Exophiala oligosperma]
MFDYLIIGAGPSGLCAAKTILECEPEAKVKVLDANQTLGGVWSKQIIYPSLKTNNLRGGIDFSDFPMHDGFGIQDGQHPTGDVMHEYYKAYAERSKLLSIIDFDTQVNDISRLEGARGWVLKTVTTSAATTGGASQTEYTTKKLLVATGITNLPHRPTLEGSEDFGGPIIHSAELGFKGDLLFANENVETVAVLGGGKSAYDSVQAAGKAGRQVEWIIRKSGKGPEWVFPSHTKIGPFTVPREFLPARRAVSFFSPCLWDDGFDKFRYFVHSTSVGKFVAQKFWANLHEATIQDCGMRNDERTRVLEPEQSPFWYGTASGVYNFEKDIYEMVKSGQVRVHREDIDHLSKGHITFKPSSSTDPRDPPGTGSRTSDPSIIQVDAVITATGFSAKPTVTFSPTSTHSDLGIPSTTFTRSQHDFWASLDRAADEKLSVMFPRLTSGPFMSPSSNTVQPYNPGADAEVKYTPFRLYRGIAPPGPTADGKHDLVFIGMFSNLANTPRMELQCLWGYAYLNGHFESKIDRDTVYDESALMSRFSKFRAPFGHGRFFPDLVFDQVPYMDTLLRDLGLKYWRKPGWLRELFEPYRAKDYRGVVKEWLSLASVVATKPVVVKANNMASIEVVAEHEDDAMRKSSSKNKDKNGMEKTPLLKKGV